MPHLPRRCLLFPASFNRPLLAAGLMAAACVTPHARAVQPERFEHTTESDFAEGTFDGAVVTNLGDLKLATAAQEIGELPEDVDYVYDLANVNGTSYAAVGPQGQVLAWDGQAWQPFADFADAQVFALLPHHGQLLAAVSGASAGIHMLDADGQAQVVALPDDVRYVWDLVAVGEQVALATGPEGKVLAIDPAGVVSELLDTAQANVLALAAGRGAWQGHLFAGTDTDGLIYRIDAQGRPFVVYDAGEPEVSALVVAADGTLYAGTADAEQATPGRLEDPEEDDNGRPDQEPDQDPAGQAAVADAAPAEPEAADQDLPVADLENQPDAEPEADYDALREEVRRRITAAAAGKKIKAASAPAPTRRARSSDDKKTEGNAVYRVDPQGFVSEVFRESVMVLSLALTDDEGLLIGTGNEGQLYRLDPDAGETALQTEIEGQQILAAVSGDNGVTVAAANPAGVHHLTAERVEEGTYTSDVLDAEQISLWGTARLSVRLPSGAGLSFATRSGNVADPEIGGVTGWSAWSDPQALAAGSGGVAPLQASVDAPPARFLQYRITLSADGHAVAPALTGLTIAYVTPNLRPKLNALTAAYPKFPGVDKPASPTLTAEWEASDANDDRLTYTLQQRPATADDTAAPWLTLADAIDDTSFEWDTRLVPDGYYELRIRAQDGSDNPGTMALSAARRSDPVLVDNTAPALNGLDIAVSGSVATVSGVAADAHSPIHSVAYRLNDAQDESPLLPTDLIYDSTHEAWSIKLSDLSPGTHLLSLRVTDLRGNRSFHARRFDVQ